jgi:5'-methylthioadenosine phosphorylase
VVAIIGGTVFSGIEALEGARPMRVKTKYGEVFILKGEGVIFLPRHGEKRNIPPHRINHKANIWCLKEMGVKWIVGVNSVGSLHKRITPEYFVVPHDYINFSNIPTFFDDECVHITPGMDEELREAIISSLRDSGEPFIDNGVYIQTKGPRLETTAEVRMLSNFGDIVGMTMASEATASKELGLRYASICSVDNFCHGIEARPLRAEEIRKNAQRKAKAVKKILADLIKRLP